MQPQEKQFKAKFPPEGTRTLIKLSEENIDLNYSKYLHLYETVAMMWEGMKNEIELIPQETILKKPNKTCKEARKNKFINARIMTFE